ncbi:YibE/F family protein [Modestobacter roseus]|uniref:Putative membrane protein n=1 Tax=Modestobacter roseus TaxID=1181884 RepID=A0A562IS19_9ACTN|nr:YibE/F family protein [Modestobacter roseus]MQA35668.1 YibE/F family protein [Modestobacter roseus]TWH73525.1 putative membrane protein [Modestobacter roseus]
MTAHSHGHGPATDGELPPPDPAAVARRRWAVRLMLYLLVPVGLATVAGLVVFWPSSEPTAAEQAADDFFPPGQTYPVATVSSLQPYDCSDPGGEALTCATAVMVVGEGESRGDFVQVDLPPEVVSAGVAAGDELVLTRDPVEGGQATYQFSDFARGTPIVVLALAFALVVGAVARLRGLLSLVGLGFAFVVLLEFMLPALLEGGSPLWISLIGSSAIMFVVLYLAHGFNARATTALVGTLFGLALSAVLGTVAVGAARLLGFNNEENLQLLQLDRSLDFSGLVIAATVVAGLGILNDVSITQASAVWQLHDVSPEMGWRQLFARGMAIGRDHIASTVYTIVFAYAGAALPLLMLFEIYQRPFWTTLTGAEVGEEVIRTLVGGIALVLAVPVTTLVGALVATAASSAAPAPGSAAPTPEPTPEEQEAERRRERLRAMRQAAAEGSDPPRPRDPR